MRALLFAAALLLAVPAVAQEPLMNRGAICDTLPQAQAFIDAWDGTNNNEALAIANGDLEPDDACGFAIFVYIPGESLGTATTSTGIWEFMEIAVLGYCSRNGQCSPNEPELQYTAFKVGEAPPQTSL